MLKITVAQQAIHEEHKRLLKQVDEVFNTQVGGHLYAVKKTGLTGALGLYKGYLLVTILGIRENAKDARRVYAVVIKEVSRSGSKWLCTRGQIKLY